jgi:hypothetical protein
MIRRITMAGYEGEAMILQGVDGSSFEGICRGYALETKTPNPGETVFTALGEYAICQLDSDMWQLLPEERWTEAQHFPDKEYSGEWATAEDLRTRAGEGTFLPEHMDLIDSALFRDQRKTNATNKLAVAGEDDLRALLADHNVPTDHWTASVRRLAHDIRIGGPTKEKENISLHLVDDALWLSTAQTMVNVYHTDKDGQTYKLRETDIVYFDDHRNQHSKRSNLRSSLGETGHITGERPERPYATARRGLREELGLQDGDIAKLVATGSLLRIKERGHHSYSPIKAQDRTHYFRADLEPQAVRPEYINREYHPWGGLSAVIKLGWFISPTLT